MSLLELNDVARSYGGVKAVDGVSLSLAPGEWIGIIGPNGAGKSTLFNIIGGQVSVSSGKVSLLGRDITRLRPDQRYRAGISRSFQTSSLFPDLTVREQLTLACRQKSRWSVLRSWHSDKALAARVDHLLDVWNLGRHEGSSLPDEMSYGAQRRLELALAVSSEPKLLLLDEPNVGLTASECDDLRARIRELDPTTAVVFVAHDMAMVMGWSHRVLVMHQGKMVADDTPEAIAKNPFVEEVYLGAQ